MIKLTKILAILFCLMLFTCLNAFAQVCAEAQGKPEFQKIDADKNGFVSSAEMQTYQGEKFKQLDSNKNGLVDSEELSGDNTVEYEGADTNQDGKISPQESESQFHRYFAAMDTDKDNQISIDEYTDYWKLRSKF